MLIEHSISQRLQRMPIRKVPITANHNIPVRICVREDFRLFCFRLSQAVDIQRRDRLPQGGFGKAVFFTFTFPMPVGEAQGKRQSQTNHKGENDSDGIVVRVDFHSFLGSHAFKLVDR